MSIAELKNTWTVGAGRERVPAGRTEDGDVAWDWHYFVAAHNAWGERFYWGLHLRDSAHARRVARVTAAEIRRREFRPAVSSSWQEGDVVYGSLAYAQDWHAQEYARMDDEERAHYRA